MAQEFLINFFSKPAVVSGKSKSIKSVVLEHSPIISKPVVPHNPPLPPFDAKPAAELAQQVAVKKVSEGSKPADKQSLVNVERFQEFFLTLFFEEISIQLQKYHALRGRDFETVFSDVRRVVDLLDYAAFYQRITRNKISTESAYLLFRQFVLESIPTLTETNLKSYIKSVLYPEVDYPESGKEVIPQSEPDYHFELEESETRIVLDDLPRVADVIKDQIAKAKLNIEKDAVVENMSDIDALMSQYSGNKSEKVENFKIKLRNCLDKTKSADRIHVGELKKELGRMLDGLQAQEDAYYQSSGSMFSLFANTMKKWNSSLQPKINKAREIVAALDQYAPEPRHFGKRRSP